MPTISVSVLRNGLVTLGLALLPWAPIEAGQPSAEVKADFLRALDAAEQGHHEESHGIWARLLGLGPSALGDEVFQYVRSQVYLQAYKKVEEAGEDCSKALRWVERGTAPGPPNYVNPGDAFYPFLLLAEGVCYGKRERYEEAYARLSLAKAELRKVKDDEIAQAIAQADHFLRMVEPHVVSEGDYVTNSGVLQAWIGKVTSRRSDTLVVQITYANDELSPGYAKGQQVELKLVDCKRLGAISSDAAIKGWRN